jgi:hypothetical protein
MGEAQKNAPVPLTEGEKVVATGEREETGMTTNSQREIARVLENSDRTNLCVSSIAQWLGCTIIEGRLRPGNDLNTVDLSKQFHTSRTPVKEALLLLEKEEVWSRFLPTSVLLWRKSAGRRSARSTRFRSACCAWRHYCHAQLTEPEDRQAYSVCKRT